MANILAIHKTITTNARAKNRFAFRLILLVNHNCRAKVSPVNIVPRKTRSYRLMLIWNAYGFK
jgi:hypothetical protein